MQYKYINKSIQKNDAEALVTGQPVYMDDLAPKDCLIVKVMHSPHAHAKITQINTDIAMKVPGIECILTYKDVPQIRFTLAGQTYPEASPYDHLILDQTLRYVGDSVAIIAGTDEKTVKKAMKLIKVEYEILPSLLTAEEAIDNKTIIHPEDGIIAQVFTGFNAKRNLCATATATYGDFGKEMKNSEVIHEAKYHNKANAQAMTETFRTYTYFDQNRRLNILSSTQIPFHLRRIAARALGIPAAKIKVIKPRIGGGFGAKQTVATDLFPAIVTLKTGKASKIIYTRQETFTASTSRHDNITDVKIGSTKDGHINALSISVLANTGAFGDHGFTVTACSAKKTLPIYSKAKSFHSHFDVVYTNTMPAGAYRGYGATQGCFAVEMAMNELAVKLNMDPTELRLKNLISEGDKAVVNYNMPINSCTLDKCITTGKKMIDWDNKYPFKKISKDKIRSVGMALSMQGSGVAGIDKGAVEVRLNDDGFYTLLLGATDLGTGCDTILAQMVAEKMQCSLDKVVTADVDTDASPFDTGAYASSVTYVTGMAIVKTCEELLEKMYKAASLILEKPKEQLEFNGTEFFVKNSDKKLSLDALAQKQATGFQCDYLTASQSFSSPVSPPPFVAGFAEVEIDLRTGEIELIDFVGVVDCGTVINPNLARVQAEGGLAQGIGMALSEDVVYNSKGRMITDTFFQYKLPTRIDAKKIRVAFESSYEPTGPFGAKSIGEVVINTPSPAIASAVFHGIGFACRSLPVTAEKVLASLNNKYNL